MAIYIPKHFSIKEYVPPHVYDERGDKAWELMDARLLRSDDLLRERYGRVFINTWAFSSDPLGMTFRQSGLRTWQHYLEKGANYHDPNPGQEITAKEKYFRSYSQHKFGRASDKKFMDVEVEEIRQDILTYCDAPWAEEIMSMELDTSWLHTDIRNCDRIKTYKP